MAVGPRLTDAAAAAAAGQCDTARRLQDAAVRSGQTKPAVARPLPSSQTPVGGTALGNYLSPMEAAALRLSDELLALWGIVKKMKKLRPTCALSNRTKLDTAFSEQCFGSPPSSECSNGTEDDVEMKTQEEVLTRVVAVS